MRSDRRYFRTLGMDYGGLPGRVAVLVARCDQAVLYLGLEPKGLAYGYRGGRKYPLIGHYG